MIQMNLTLEDNVLTCVEVPGENGESRGVEVLAVDLHKGQTHRATWTTEQFVAVACVALAGEDYDLPDRMRKIAEDAVRGFPTDTRPIP